MPDFPNIPARVSEDSVRVGTRLRCDDGFDCLEPGAIVTVSADAAGNLFIPCGCGQHFLDGQIDHVGDDHVYVGFWLEEAA